MTEKLDKPEWRTIVDKIIDRLTGSKAESPMMVLSDLLEIEIPELEKYMKENGWRGRNRSKTKENQKTKIEVRWFDAYLKMFSDVGEVRVGSDWIWFERLDEEELPYVLIPTKNVREARTNKRL
jgi:hypothetical protein